MVLNFMIAGRDTTSCLLTNLFICLAENLKEERRLIHELAVELPLSRFSKQQQDEEGAEQQQLARKDGKNGSSGEKVRKASATFEICVKGTSFATACFNETLRLFPPVSE